MIAISAFTSMFASVFEPMPAKFTITEKPNSWVPTFDISTDQFKLGKLYRNFVNPSLEYEFCDFQDTLLVKARMRWIMKGPEFDFFDANDNLIGIMEERLFTFFPTLDIISPIGERLASAKLNFFGNIYTFSDPMTNQTIATLSRPFMSLRVFWTLELVDDALFSQKGIDPVMFILATSLQTDRDNWQSDPLITYAEKKEYAFEMYSKSKSPSPINWGLLQKELESYRNSLEGIEPSEADVQAVSEYADAYLAGFDRTFSTQEGRIAAGLRTLMPLLKEGNLTQPQKTALFLMIDSMIER